MEEWIQGEFGEELNIQVKETQDRQVFKVWCEGKGSKEMIWEARRKWEEGGIAEDEGDSMEGMNQGRENRSKREWLERYRGERAEGGWQTGLGEGKERVE